ncbi:MAG TPA: class I SAM-dependent methyltransferase [Micromonosporaceae bacterium]|nr:class I SAM-dependent methyltransferase [Micromonosporaceae bacterium]
MTTFDAHRLSFGGSAAHYDRIRPSYPPQAVRWALGETPCRVVDLGAGTGKLTQALLRCQHRVIPVDPDIRMLARLAAAAPEVTPLAGSAEAVPLTAGCVDAVVAGQAYHWFDQERAPAEIARVLRDGGVFAPVWNIRDEAEPWVAALSEILYGDDRCAHDGWRAPDLGPAFGPVQRAAFRHATTHTPESLVALVRSRSYYLTARAPRRAQLEARVRELATTHPQLRGRESFPLPYLTVAYRAVRALRS